MDRIPRTTRAQKMDALSSTANLVGYRAVVEAAAQYGSFFTQQITAAGKVPPAKVLIIGAGVAGLAAIGAARGLGAVVRAFDTRAAVREQVQSLGAEFLEVNLAEDGDGGGGYAKEMSPAFIEAEMALFMEQAKQVDVVITTALIPGKRAPILWPKAHVEAMKPGSVVIDLAAEQGGNCEVTRADEVVVHNGVKVVGYTDYASRLATTASNLYATNLVHLLTDLGGAAQWDVNLEDEILRGATVIKGGEVLPPPPPVQPSPQGAAKPAAAAPAATPAPPKPAAAPSKSHGGGHAPAPEAPGSGVVPAAIGLALAALWVWLRFQSGGEVASPATTTFLQHLTVFVLACFVGWQVVWNVTAALHTPLMSVTNAISGIILLGGMLQAKGDPLSPATLLGTAAILFAVINVAGGFLVTQRMLKMFRK
jgi:NAD(P) transhydrogenase subunit alpha